MPLRSELLSANSLPQLLIKHPYLFLFQKEAWVEYLELIAQIYDLIEESGHQAPFEGVRVLSQRYFRDKEVQFAENKTSSFLIMCIEELKVLKDSHDAQGRRWIEITRQGKQLLQLVEELLAQRVKYSGTGAETLLGALNEALTSQPGYTKQQAIEHHRQKIKAYKDDLKRIEELGPQAAELLPIPHSTEALFSQAESAAIDILGAVEDVKQAIEKERKNLAQNYLDTKLSAGQSVNSVADFYQNLQATPTYQSYNHAKHLFSQLEGFGHRFLYKDIRQALSDLERDEKLPADQLKRSQLSHFQKQFELADFAIQEKIRAQLQLLQLQVRYSMSTDLQGVQTELKTLLQQMLSHKPKVLDFFSDSGVTVQDRSLGPRHIELHPFVEHFESEEALFENQLETDETKELILALLRAEEATLKDIVQRLRLCLKQQTAVELDKYDFRYGLAEYYVLSEIELFDQEIVKEPLEIKDFILQLKHNAMVIKDAPCYRFTMRT